MFGTFSHSKQWISLFIRKGSECGQHHISGLEIATNTVAFATDCFPFGTKISGEVANLRLVFIALLKQKG